MIRLRDIEMRYGDVVALTLPAFDLDAGERVGVRGTNGSGKSTLLRILAGLLVPTSGTVNGLPPRGRVVLVHQRPHLFRGTARDNVVYGLRLAGRERDEADALLSSLDAGHLADRTARDLSGGERRRIAIARALAVDPDVLLLDEPYAALDADGQQAVSAVVEGFAGSVVIAAPDLDGVPVTRTISLGGG